MTAHCCGAFLVGITPVSGLGRCVACGELVLSTASVQTALAHLLANPSLIVKPGRAFFVDGVTR